MKITSNINDQDLTQMLAEGSRDAFHLLYLRYGVRIRKFARLYLRDEHDSEELVQDVFLKLWDKRESLHRSGNLKAFIFKVAVNGIYDFIRKRNIAQAYLDYSGSGTVQSDQTWDEVVFNDMFSYVSRLIERMPGQRKEIFMLSKQKGLSNDEIAAKLNLSKRTVENQLYRATSFLKKNLSLESVSAGLFFYLFC